MSSVGARKRRKLKRIHLQMKPHTFQNGLTITDSFELTKLCRLLNYINLQDLFAIYKFNSKVYELAYSAKLLSLESKDLLSKEAQDFIEENINRY